MTFVPLSQQPSHPSDPADTSSRNEAPVLTLKQLVVQLNREQKKFQELMSSLGFALRSFNNLNQFLELIPLMASRVTDADGGALVLFRPDGQLQLERLHCHNLPECQGIRNTLEAASRHVFATLTPTSSLAQATAVLDQQVHYWLEPDVQIFGTPILVKNQERGRLYVFSHNPEYLWTETRQKLIRLIADQTAVAIENDELTVALRKKERLDRELEIGAEIQEQLLPHACPTIAGLDLAFRWQPAGRVGGDYFDFIPENYDQMLLSQRGGDATGCWSIVIGDVMGKGVPAGLIMTMLRGTLRAEVLNGHSPARILQHLNQLMYLDLENSNRFVTLFFSWYDPQSYTLAYSNAAHNPPLLWQSRTQSIRRLDASGMLIGLDLHSQYQDAEVQLHPGDIVIYYTDGFMDAANQKGERFDEDNFIRHFQQACKRFDKPQPILDYLFDQVQQFIGLDHPNVDDMTLIVMRVQSEV